MRPARRGFVLLATILFVIVVGILLRVAVTRMPSATGAAKHSKTRLQAHRAALSGHEYAMAQLREDPTWQGGEARQMVVDSGRLKVEQERGNVRGTILGSDGSRSEFLIRFNLQDGEQDPSEEMTFDLPYVSLNNLRSDTEAIVPQDQEGQERIAPPHSVSLTVEGRAVDSGGQVISRQRVESIYQFSTSRAINDAVIMAGGGLDMTVNGSVNLGGTFVEEATDKLFRLRSKHGLSVTKPDGSPAKLDVVGQAEAELSFDDSQYSAAADYNPAKVSLAGERHGDSKDFYNLPWESVSKAGSESDAVTIPGGTYVFGKFPGDGRDGSFRYFDTSYDDYLSTPDPGAGVVLSSDLAEVRTDSLALTGGSLTVGPKAVITRYGRSYRRESGFQWAVKGVDVQVTPSANSGVSDLAIIPRDPKAFSDDDPTEYPDRGDPFSPDSLLVSLTGTTVSSAGDVVIQGGVSGQGGTLTSEGEVQILAGKTLVIESSGRSSTEQQKEFDRKWERLNLSDLAEGESPSAANGGEGESTQSALQLNIYAKGDLNISTRISQGLLKSSYRNLAFKGLLYSWGDVNIVAHGANARGFGNSNQLGRNRNSAALYQNLLGQYGAGGKFVLQGSLVAYGSDPENGSPGSSEGEEGSGRVRIAANSADLYWDPRFLPSLTELQPEGRSIFELRRSFISYPK
jgi:hypothetical protein